MPQLGTSWAIPIEVIPFGWEAQARYLEAIGATPKLRQDGDAPFQTDQGNLILDADFGAIAEPATLARQLEARAGIVEHGLFIGMARDVVVAGAGWGKASGQRLALRALRISFLWGRY